MDTILTASQPCRVIALITAIVGVLSSLTALWISVGDRLLTRAKEKAEAAIERDRLQKLARDEEMALAAPVQARLTLRLAGADPSTTPATWMVVVSNNGSFPVMNVRVHHTSAVGASSSEPFDLQGGGRHKIDVTNAETPLGLDELAVEFTDPAGRHWQRRLTGGLHLGTLQNDGTYLWDEPRFPEPQPQPVGQYFGNSSPSRLLPRVLLVLIAIGCLLYLLLR